MAWDRSRSLTRAIWFSFTTKHAFQGLQVCWEEATRIPKSKRRPCASHSAAAYHRYRNFWSWSRNHKQTIVALRGTSVPIEQSSAQPEIQIIEIEARGSEGVVRPRKRPFVLFQFESIFVVRKLATWTTRMRRHFRIVLTEIPPKQDFNSFSDWFDFIHRYKISMYSGIADAALPVDWSAVQISAQIIERIFGLVPYKLRKFLIWFSRLLILHEKSPWASNPSRRNSSSEKAAMVEWFWNHFGETIWTIFCVKSFNKEWSFSQSWASS
mgnify:CR=1 FL=1